MIPSPDLAILRHLAARTHATAGEIGIACRMAAAEVRARLVMLESMRLVAGRRDPDAIGAGAPRVYVITAEGRQKAGMSDARATPAV